MLKRPKTTSSARHDAARLPCAGIQSKVSRSTALSDEPPTDPDMEQKSGNLVPGGRVVFLSRSGLHRGILKYVGGVQFGEGEWCEVELDAPEDGCHCGAVNDVEYFRCEESRGVFVERWKVCREGQEEEMKAADGRGLLLPAKTLTSPENETRIPQLKFKSKIPSSLKSKTMKSSSSSAMTPLKVTTVLDVAKSTEGQVHVRTFVDLRGGGDGENIELRGQTIKERESLTAGSGQSGDSNVQHHYSTVKTIRRSQSRGYRSSVNDRVKDPETGGMAVGSDGKVTIPLLLAERENSGRSKSDQSSICPTNVPSHGKDCLYKVEFSERHLEHSGQTEHTKRQRRRDSDGNDELDTANVLSNNVMTSVNEVSSEEAEGFQSDNEDLRSTGCCIKSFISLYNHSVKDSHSVAADDGRSSAKVPPLCQGQQPAAESGSVCSGEHSQTDRPVVTNVEDDSTGSKALMPDVIGPSAFFSKIPRLQKTNDEEEEDEFGDADYLAASQSSLASSLGILNDSDILEDTCLFPEGFVSDPRHPHEKSEDQPKQDLCLAETYTLSDLQSAREVADRSDEVVSRDDDDQPMTEGEIAAAAGVGSNDVLPVEMEGHSTELDLTETPPQALSSSSSSHLNSAEQLKAEIDESPSDVHNVQLTDSEDCAENIFSKGHLQTSDENVTIRDGETSDLTATVEKIGIDALGNQEEEEEEADDCSLSRIVVQVELERQLVDRQKHRLSYDDTSDVSDQPSEQVSSGQLDKESSRGQRPSGVATPDKERSSAVFDKTQKQAISPEPIHQEVEKSQGRVGDGGGSCMGSKTKLIKTIQSRNLSTLHEKNEDMKPTALDGNVEKEANRQRRGEDKRQTPTGRTRMSVDMEKPSVKGISNVQRNLGRVKSLDASSTPVPAISTPRTAPSVADNSGASSVNRLRRNRVASLDLGNSSSLSSSISLKRGSMRRETLRETNVGEQTSERGNTDLPQNGKARTAAAAKKRPSLLLPLNSSFKAGKTYAIIKNNKTPSDSNLFGCETIVSSSMLSRRTSTPLPCAEDPASCSSSMSLESGRLGLQEKKQPSVSANKKGLKNQTSVINSKSKPTTAAKCGQLKPKIYKRNEKNSDGKTNSKQEQEWLLQQHHQPDLVPNADAKDREMDEIIRLEQLSEARLQQLTHLNTEFQRRTKWFQALAIVVQQLSQRLDSEDHNGLRCRLKESLEQLDSMKQQLHELMRQRDALIDEIQSVKEEEEQQRETLKQEHQVQLRDWKNALQMQHEENLRKALNEHSEKIAAVEVSHQQKINELKEFHEQIVSKNQEDHMSSLNAQMAEHDSILQEVKNQQDRQLNDITLRFEHIKLSLSEKVECLRSECDEMRRREAAYMESCQMEMEQKLHLALLPYRHLPQEIESLTAILDLRNLELHDLRHHNLQLQRQAEELPAAQETIKKFQQKVENLEAVIKIRTDYERQLSEKHQQLLRRYDRESKANKRLSMDKEELLWRLSSSQSTEHSEASASPSFDAFQRSLSHYLANDCAGGVSPSGGDVRFGVDLATSVSETASSSFLSTSPGVPRIQRSGTYDLLCDVLDDENTRGSRLSPDE